MKLYLQFCFFLFLCYKIAVAQISTFASPPDSSHVLVVYNSQDQTSIDIMTYYKDARNIPEETNVIGLSELDTLIDITHNGVTHTIYLDQQGEIIRDTNNQHSLEPTIHAWLYFNERIA